MQPVAVMSGSSPRPLALTFPLFYANFPRPRQNKVTLLRHNRYPPFCYPPL